jgi:uncharacterized protein (DUF488 family)
MGAPEIWTVGHSTHELPVLADLLRRHRIDAVADVRSQPFSRRNPQFNRENLSAHLVASGLRYVFLGMELGGRPPEAEFYDGKGHVLYGEVAKTERFGSGLERLLTGASQYRVAILCAEENPARCHRRLLISRVLVERGVIVRHIRGDGSMITEEELDRLSPVAAHPALFDE